MMKYASKEHGAVQVMGTSFHKATQLSSLTFQNAAAEGGALAVKRGLVCSFQLGLGLTLLSLSIWATWSFLSLCLLVFKIKGLVQII